jgi:beta-glucosidase
MRKVSRAKMGGARVCSTLPAVVLLVIFCALSSGVCRSQTAASQTSGKPDAGKPWLNTAWTPEQRAAVLVDRMTLEEKASQLVNQARAIPRLGVPAYDWWSEALHGVLANGTTSFPEPIGLAATFDTAGIHEMAEAIAVEGRIKHAQDGEPRDGQAGHSNVYEGLDFWAPNVNIFRDPRWGRGQETYGEDPFLSARMGVAYVTGMQGDDPQHYRAIATPKHFAVHSGPESTRHNADVQVSKHDELDTYLPAFRAAVTEGQAGSVMCAYNAINGEPACANQFLLQDQLRGHWGFKGYVVSDCGAVLDIHDGHKFTATQAESSAISLRRGMDNECVDASFKVTGKRDYQPYLDAISQGFLRETEIDTALTRLFTARIKLFDPPALDPYAHIDAAMLDSTAHRDLARKLANESMVLLKNDGVLPLKTGLKIALVGPLATQTKVLLGNYNGNPSHTVSILEGLRNELGMDNIRYVAGTQFLSTESEAVPASALSTAEGKPGLNASYFPFTEETLSHPGAAKAVAQRREDTVDATTAALPAAAASVKPLAIRWEGQITAPETGDYNLGMVASGYFRIKVDGKEIALAWSGNSLEPKLGRVHLEAGKPARLEVDCAFGYAVYNSAGEPAVARLVWSRVDTGTPSAVLNAALDAARAADVVVAVVGITSELEGEEMEVSEPGFSGGDRTSLDLPKPEEDLLEALKATGKPLVVVLTNGSALAVNWAGEHANAMLDAFYPGEEGGAAVAQTLTGRNNPAGRLPVTFYKDVSQLPPFADYGMKGRTYRYFTGTPLYPFGYGLSYTKFAYSALSVPASIVQSGPICDLHNPCAKKPAPRAPVTVPVDVTVTNIGSCAGDEVAELYLRFPKTPGAPLTALRGFQRVHLGPGASQKLHFELSLRDISMVSDAGDVTVPAGQFTVSVGGGQPGTVAPSATGTFSLEATVGLPE